VTSITVQAFEKCWRHIAREVTDIAEAKGFHSVNTTELERFALIHEEIGEATSALRHRNPSSEKIPGYSQIEEELADAVIRIMDAGEVHGRDVVGALVAKIEYNKSREYLHGKTQ